MKNFFKVFGVISLILIIGFLSLGFIYPEVNYTSEITVEKPVRIVFRKYNDPGTLKHWIPELKSLEILDIKSGMVGTRMKMTIENQGRTIEILEEVTAYEEDRILGILFEAGPMIKTNHIEFVDQGESTLIKGEYSCKGTNHIYKSLFSLFGSQFRKADETYLQNFKTFAEK